MSDFDAYEDEMRRFLGFSDRDIDRLLDGRTPANDGEFDDLAAFLSETKAALAQAPPTDVEEAHLAAIVETARISADKGEPVTSPASKAHGPDRASGLPKWRRSVMSNRFVSLAAKMVATAVAAMTLTAGLAFAGVVDLPDAADDAFAAVGVTLPDQAGGDDIDTDILPDDPEITVNGDGPDENASPVAFAVFDVISNWTGEHGCEFGIAVATAATTAAGQEFTTENDPCAAGENGQATGATRSAEGKATGSNASSSGQETGETKSAEGRQTGSDASTSGQTTGEEKSQQGQQAGGDGQTTGEEKSQQGQQAGGDASSSGQSTGEEKSQQGQSNRP